MPSIDEVYKYYLKAADLEGKPRTVQIKTATRDQVFDPQLKRNKPCIELTFHKKLKVMALNKTQARELAEILGTDDYTQWTNAVIVLNPDTHNKKDTITITASPHPAPMATPQPPATAAATPKPHDPAQIIKELYADK